MNAENITPEDITPDAAPATYAERIAQLEAEGCSTSDAQAIADAEAPEYDPEQDEDDEPEEETQDALFNEDHRATYCPEDDKLRLYVGRVPRPEYLELRAEGWTSTPKQSEAGQGEFAAIWTPARKRRAERYAGIIEDEDAGPAERAADRAERFTGYREKRRSEAHGHADSYDAPRTHGYQSERRAQAAADRHDRHGSRAVDAWSKAEYWQRRTAGVISHALHLSTPAVRMGRIKTLEAELRKAEKTNEGYAERYRKIEGWAANMEKVLSYHANRFHAGDMAEAQRTISEEIAGYGTHRNPLDLEAAPAYYFQHTQSEHPPTAADYAAHYLKTHHNPESEGFNGTSIAQEIAHLRHRIAYELQMIEAQGGRAAFVEMEPGGFIGGFQVQKVNKSPATGRTVSVQVLARTRANFDREGKEYNESNPRPLTLHTMEVEKMKADAYRPPTDEEREAFHAAKKEAKKAAPKADPCPIINPTDADAEKLQSVWNAANPPSRWDSDKEPKKVQRMTQAQYSANSGGSYSRCETVIICEHGTAHRTRYGRNTTRHSIFKVREFSGRVIVITDKPQKPLPWEAIEAARAKCPTLEGMKAKIAALRQAMGCRHGRSPEEEQLLSDAAYAGLINYDTYSPGWTEAGFAVLKEYDEANRTEEKRFVLVND